MQYSWSLQHVEQATQQLTYIMHVPTIWQDAHTLLGQCLLLEQEEEEEEDGQTLLCDSRTGQ